MQKYNLNDVFRFEGIAFGLFMPSILYSSVEIYRIYHDGKSWTEIDSLAFVPVFLAAWVTLIGLTRQARIAQQIEDERYLREERAAQSDLPLATSALVRLCKDAIDFQIDRSPQEPNFPAIEDNLSKYRDAIRFSNETTGRRLLGIIRMYQVLASRFEGRRHDQRRAEIFGYDHNYWSEVCNWACLAARIEQVFDYARGEASEISDEPVNQRVRSQFFGKIFNWEDYAELEQILSERSTHNSFENGF